MKRFAGFSFEEYYPGGGWCDFVDSYDTLEEAMASTCNQIVDLSSGKIVYGDGKDGL